jgi:hypothetical protein
MFALSGAASLRIPIPALRHLGVIRLFGAIRKAAIAGGLLCFCAERVCMQRLVAGDGLFDFGLGDGGGWLDLSEGDEAGLLLLA